MRSNPPTDPSLFDIAEGRRCRMSDDTVPIFAIFRRSEEALSRARPEIVFHLAAQSIVRLSYAIPVETFSVNVMGTAHLLHAIRQASVAFARRSSSRATNATKMPASGQPYRETDPMGGHDPYSASKGCAELVVTSFRASAAALGSQGSDIAIASVRSGNVVGGGDWSPDRLVPDCIRAFVAGVPVKLRNPEAVRPWLHVLEPLSGYILARGAAPWANFGRYATAFNFGPHADNDANVLRVAQAIAKLWGDQARRRGSWRTHFRKQQRFDWIRPRPLRCWVGSRDGTSPRRLNGQSNGTGPGKQGVTCVS